MKRGRSGGSKTGGTGDVKPNILTLSTGTAGAVAQYVTSSVALPVPRFGSQKNLSTIFELLAVDWYLQLENIADTTSTDWAWLSTAITRSDAETSTLATLVADVADPRAFAVCIVGKTFTTSGAGVQEMPIHIDLTDNNGNGFLIATDRLNITSGNAGGAAAGTTFAKILYRLVNVGVEEYVGIVQSQQGN